MKLKELIGNIDSLLSEGTVFAKRIGPSFHPDSEAEVIALTDDEISTNVRDLAIRRAPGKEYFLEVSIILEILDDLRKDKQNIGLSQDQELEKIINYAEKDA